MTLTSPRPTLTLTALNLQVPKTAAMPQDPPDGSAPRCSLAILT